MTTLSGHTSAIRAKKVIGTSVKDTSGATIGKVEDIVLDKLSNNIMYAIVGFGGFLGIGEKYHPLPWSVLDYDPDENGYVVNISKEQLKAAPAYSMEELSSASVFTTITARRVIGDPQGTVAEHITRSPCQLARDRSRFSRRRHAIYKRPYSSEAR